MITKVSWQIFRKKKHKWRAMSLLLSWNHNFSIWMKKYIRIRLGRVKNCSGWKSLFRIKIMFQNNCEWTDNLEFRYPLNLSKKIPWIWYKNIKTIPWQKQEYCTLYSAIYIKIIHCDGLYQCFYSDCSQKFRRIN